MASSQVCTIEDYKCSALGDGRIAQTDNESTRRNLFTIAPEEGIAQATRCERDRIINPWPGAKKAPQIVKRMFPSAAWRSPKETHGFASRSRDRFAFVGELRLSSAD